MNGPERACPRGDQAVALVLHGSEPDEEPELREHLAGCRSCQDTVADAELVAAALAEAVEQVDPPPRLRESILARADRTPQVGTDRDRAPAVDRGEEGSAAHGRGGRGRGGTGPARPTGGARGSRGPGRRRRRTAIVALALVAAVGIAGVGGLVAYTVQVQQQRDAQIAQSQALADVLTQLDRPGTSRATLSTSDGEAVGAVVAGASARMVMTAGLAPNDRDTSIYVLWGVSTEADPQPIGAFDVAAEPGPEVHQLDPAGEESPFIGYAISLEPGRVAPSAPTTVVASGQVQA